MVNAYAIDSAASEKRILADLRRKFSTDRETRSRRSVTYYDTFEWRLFRRGTTLSSWDARDQSIVCWQSNDGRNLHRMLDVPLPGFAHQMPSGAFRDELAACVEIRRLLPVVCLELRTIELRILDEHGKTVARALFERGFASTPNDGDVRRRLAGTLTIVPLLGYDRKGRQVTRFVDTELGLSPAEPQVLARALAAVGRRPANVDTKLRIRLDREMTAEQAVREILCRLLETMRLNEAGLREDLDSEFLHDFRVAVRRTRTVLGQIKHVLPAARLAHFRGEFKWLGGLTGPTRDLDVYLLKLPAYRALLPPEHREDLAPLEELLRQRQRTEHGRVVEGLDSKRYLALMRDWAALLAAPAPATETEAPRPAVLVASERLRRAHRRVLRQGRRILENPSAEKLHRLRIECKKLRYLLEFFVSLYDEAEIRRLVKSLKRLQDNLGDFNDLELQQRALAGFAKELADEGRPGERTLVALGRLVERLAAEQDRQQRQFAERFQRFARRENQARVRALFGRGKHDT